MIMTVTENARLNSVVMNMVRTIALRLVIESARALSIAFSYLLNDSTRDTLGDEYFSRIKSFYCLAAFSSFQAKITNVDVKINYITPPKTNSQLLQNYLLDLPVS
jgi:hypothetical protein